MLTTKKVEPFTIRTEFLDDQVDEVQVSRYEMGKRPIALQLLSYMEGPLATATVNLENYGYVPAEGNVIIKDDNENEGMLAALQEAGIVGEVVRSFSYGYVTDGAHEVPLAPVYSEQA